MQQLLDRFKIGRIDSGTFRFCGREYVQSADGMIQINCRDHTRAIRPIDVHKSEKGATPVSKFPAHSTEVCYWFVSLGSTSYTSKLGL